MDRPPKPNRDVGLAARQVATALLTAVLQDGLALDAVIDGGESGAPFNRLPPRDRRLARAIVATALRHHGEITAILDRMVEKRPRDGHRLMAILETAIAQILFMEVADHAAVSIAVTQVGRDRRLSRYKGLANGVLRGVVRERTLYARAPDEAARLNTPDWLWERWSAVYGPETCAAIAAAHGATPGLDLSVKGSPAEWSDTLGGIVLPTGSVRLPTVGMVSELAGFERGDWWVQDAAAALPARLLGDVDGLEVADLCAAPGGKTAQLAAAGARVTAVDVSAGRLKRLAPNLTRLQLEARTVAADIMAWEPDRLFDAILLDAPCTATGTIRRHPDVAWLKRPQDVAELAAVQGRMLARVAGWLKPGGVLVYCTCSLEPEEGEAQVEKALADYGLAPFGIEPQEVTGLDEAVAASGTVRTLPCQLPNADPRLSGVDGFFIARFRAL